MRGVMQLCLAGGRLMRVVRVSVEWDLICDEILLEQDR